MNDSQQKSPDEDSLDGSAASTSTESGAELATPPNADVQSQTAVIAAIDQPNIVKRILLKVNIYLILFVFLLILGAAAFAVGYLNSRKGSSGPTIDSQTLSQEAVNQLANTDAKVGDAKAVLTVQSNAVFAGQVVIGGDVSVAGSIKVGKPLTVNDLTVSGASNLTTIQGQTLALAGDATLQGKLNVKGETNLAGNVNVGGTMNAAQIIVNKLVLAGNGSFEINNHVAATGAVPNMSFGNALGGGGTATISGSD